MILMLLFFMLFVSTTNVLSSSIFSLTEEEKKAGWTENPQQMTEEECEKHYRELYNLLPSEQKNGFTFTSSPGAYGLEISHGFIQFNADEIKQEKFKINMFYVYKDSKNEKFRVFFCDILNKIDEYVAALKNKENAFLTTMNIVSVLKHPEVVFILDPSDGKYYPLNQTNMVKDYNPEKGELGWIELCRECWKKEQLKVCSSCNILEIFCIHTPLCSTCKLTSSFCLHRSGKSHFWIKYPLKPNPGFNNLIIDDKSNKEEDNQNSSWSNVKIIITLLVVTGIPFVWWLKNRYKQNKKNNNSNSRP